MPFQGYELNKSYKSYEIEIDDAENYESSASEDAEESIEELKDI